jgi:hypothetical protein
MATAFNKVTREWDSTESPELLSADWVIDPIFTNKERAMVVGPKYWVYNGNEITGLTDAEILATPQFRAEFVQEMWLRIQEERSRRQAGGVFISSANKWFHSDQSSRIQQLGLVMMGANMPGNINWKTMDSSYIVMTPAIALSIFNASATLDMTAFGVAEQHRANMMASPTPGTYDFSGFWPAIFGG